MNSWLGERPMARVASRPVLAVQQPSRGRTLKLSALLGSGLRLPAQQWMLPAASTPGAYGLRLVTSASGDITHPHTPTIGRFRIERRGRAMLRLLRRYVGARSLCMAKNRLWPIAINAHVALIFQNSVDLDHPSTNS